MNRSVFIWLRRAALALLVCAGGPLAFAPGQGPPPAPVPPPPGLGPPSVAPAAPARPPATAAPATAAPAASARPPAPAASGPLSFSRNVAGEAKPIILGADEVVCWGEPGRNVILLRGQVLIQQGYVQLRAHQAVIWVDVISYKQKGIWHIDLFADGEVRIDSSSEVKDGIQAVVSLNTRGEIKVQAKHDHVLKQPQPNDPLVIHGRSICFPAAPTPAARPPASGPGALRSAPRNDVPLLGAPIVQPVPAPALAGVGAGTPAPPADGAGPVVRVSCYQVPAPPSQPTGGPSASDQVPRPAGSDKAPILPDFPEESTSKQPVTPAPAPVPPRARPTFTLAPRSGSSGFNSIPMQVPGYPDLHAEVFTEGVILNVQNAPGGGSLDMEADRLVIFTRGDDPQDRYRRAGQPIGSKDGFLQFYLAGNVEIRTKNNKDERKLTATEVFYDVNRSTAIALTAEIQVRQPGITDPVYVRSPELTQTSARTFEVVNTIFYSSKLPSDPGLVVYVQTATVEDRDVPRLNLFGDPVRDRRTGNAITDKQTWVVGHDAYFELEGVPFFYLPYFAGDLRDPLGPVTSIRAGYDRIFGATFGVSLNVWDLLGLQPLEGTRWRADVDYLTARGPSLGTEFDYNNKDLFGIPSKYNGVVKASGIYDSGTDDLGGFRPENFVGPDGRGRFLWRQEVYDLPFGFSVQSQGAAISDRGYLEQYYKNEFDTDVNQNTYFYGKQQQDDWAWTFYTSLHDRNWVNETEFLPRFDGYLIGQSFFDMLNYDTHASATWARLRTSTDGLPNVSPTDIEDNTARIDWMQQVSLPFTLGPFRLVPYVMGDVAYYSKDLGGDDVGRVWGGVGVRGSIPFTRLYPDIQSDLLNVNGINHKIVLSADYFYGRTNTPYTDLPQLDRVNDDATDQALRDVRNMYPSLYPPTTVNALTGPLYDPQRYLIRSNITTNPDTLDDIDVFQLDLRQRWQTKRGYPGYEHIVDFMTLDLSASFYPNPERDNFGESVGLLSYDWVWNIGDRTALVSSGLWDPVSFGQKDVTFGVFFNRNDRTSFYLGYTHLEPINNNAVTASVNYVFSPKYSMALSTTYDFTQLGALSNSLVFTRIGTDLQVSAGVSYNVLTNSFGIQFMVVPNLLPPNMRGGPTSLSSLAGH